MHGARLRCVVVRAVAGSAVVARHTTACCLLNGSAAAGGTLRVSADLSRGDRRSDAHSFLARLPSPRCPMYIGLLHERLAMPSALASRVIRAYARVYREGCRPLELPQHTSVASLSRVF